ncbi:chemotaxis protein CheB [Ferruginibacter paludis]|uniref:chemotaxis protein CheB n=1 Tax=Ferruginibacter paludis TaxID=1310417 RepID=UPI0025B503A5|nr:chemotaxis protein CheB [Ferruginibacter paludis]MDN3655278.1 chemotaxis protein CheB [Ferruginibacter paludis]
MKKTVPKKTPSKKAQPQKQKSTAAVKQTDCFVAGIGASAGGLEALKVFFDHLPANSGMACVVVQHLDPTHKSLLTELLAGHTKMKVTEVKDGDLIEPNTVYVIPPNKDLRIFNSHLHLTAPAKKRGVRRPIDLFFTSLANDQGHKSIGIILSGTGSEGTLGLREVKAAGGVTFAQDPATAQFAGMPKSAIDAQTADYVLAPEKMPAQLIKYIKKQKTLLPGTKTDIAIPPDNLLNKIYLLIRNQTGCDFSGYKTNTIARRVTKRIALNQINSIEDYVNFLEKNPEEVNKLFKDFLIGVTSFFRDKVVFENIEKKTIPYLFQLCKHKQQIRIWVCGCSTGEEAYSLAILFREALLRNKEYNKIMIFASDVDQDAIEFARSGTYTESSLAGISPERLARFFTRKENGFQLTKEIREMVVFAHHNVIKDPPFSKMDLITCRNLLIYINSDLQKKLIPVFHYSLNTDGILILGTSESIGDQGDLFTDFDAKNKMFKKAKDIVVRKPTAGYELPYAKTRSGTFPPAAQNLVNIKKINVSGIIEKYLMDHYVPPSVTIDKNNEVLYFSGNTSQFLELPGGEAKLDVVKMAKKGLKIPLEEAIKKVRSDNKEWNINEVEVKVNDYFKTINLVVKPLPSKEADQEMLMVVFEPVVKTQKKINHKTGQLAKNNAGTGDLEKELKITQEYLQSAISDLDASREELQITTEEYQSSNEELQSTNEELETSREELQSVNEELITVNNELQDKIEQLSQSNDDLNNLLRSIEVATIFLDRDLKIKRFTPSASKIFNLIPSDIDRPLAHLTNNLLYKTLSEDVKESLKTLAVKSADVYSTDGTWYQMRIIPYRTVENIIEGVLVTFIEITDEKKVEETLKKTNEHLNLIMENLPAVPFTCIADPVIQFSFVGSSCEKVTGFLPEQFTANSNFWLSRIHPGDVKKMKEGFASVTKKQSLEMKFRWKCADGNYKQFINFVRYAIAENGTKAYIVGVWQEVINGK